MQRYTKENIDDIPDGTYWFKYFPGAGPKPCKVYRHTDCNGTSLVINPGYNEVLYYQKDKLDFSDDIRNISLFGPIEIPNF